MDHGRPDVLSVQKFRQQWRKSRSLQLEMHYLMVAAGTEYSSDSLLPVVKDGVTDLRRVLWMIIRSIRWWGLAPENRSSIVDFIANHLSFAIPNDVAKVDAVAHLFEVFVRILSVLRRQGCMRSTSIRPVLTDGRPTGKNNPKVAFEHSEIVRWDHVPCSSVSFGTTGSGSDEVTGRVLSECLLGDCSRPSNAQHCSNQTKTEEKAQLPFGSRPHLYAPQQKLGY